MMTRPSEPQAGHGALATAAGSACGALVALPALGVAVLSSGAGHGHYVAARILFPLPMLLTLVDNRIGAPSLGRRRAPVPALWRTDRLGRPAEILACSDLGRRVPHRHRCLVLRPYASEFFVKAEG